MNATTSMTAHLRGRIKKAGIKARVRVTPGGGSIQVFPVAYGLEFTEDEQRTIRELAKNNDLTLVRGLEIKIDQMTDPFGMTFYLRSPGFEVVDASGSVIGTAQTLEAAKLVGRMIKRREGIGYGIRAA